MQREEPSRQIHKSLFRPGKAPQKPSQNGRSQHSGADPGALGKIRPELG